METMSNLVKIVFIGILVLMAWYLFGRLFVAGALQSWRDFLERDRNKNKKGEDDE